MRAARSRSGDINDAYERRAQRAGSDPALGAPAFHQVELCTPAIGAELGNVSLADAAQDPDAIAEIRALWLKHKVLFFRDQDISPMEQQDFAARFGALEAHPLAPSHPQADKLLMLYRNVDPYNPSYVEKASRENIWHADVTYKKAPPRGAVLRCELGPETGGDTIWSNMAMAYEKLPAAIKQRIDGLFAKHSAEQTFGAQLPTADRHAMAAKNPAPSTRSCSPIPKRAKRSFSSTPPSRPTSRISSTSRTSDAARTSCPKPIT
jgi:taurine dioxygenase